MKRSLVVGLSLAAFSVVQASAADIPVKAAVRAPVVAPVFSWTGCYIGGNVGWADGSVRFCSNNIDITTWQNLATRAGGEVLGEW